MKYSIAQHDIVLYMFVTSLIFNFEGFLGEFFDSVSKSQLLQLETNSSHLVEKLL